MKINGDVVLHAPADRVWEALLDPAVLARTIPGCERLEETGEHAYAMTVSTGVASIRGTYTGTCVLHDLVPGESLVMSARGAGAPGTIAADVSVAFEDHGDGTTAVTWASDTTVGGMIGGVGQRLLGSVGRRLAAEFFHAVDDELTGVALRALEGTALESTAPADGSGRPTTWSGAAGASRAPGDDFLKGVAVGAGLVLLGVLAGAAAVGRRR